MLCVHLTYLSNLWETQKEFSTEAGNFALRKSRTGKYFLQASPQTRLDELIR